MKFFDLKKKSILRFFSRELSKYISAVRNQDVQKIKTVGILHEESQVFTEKDIQNIQERLHVDYGKIELLVFKNFKPKVEYAENEFTEKSFGWSGSLKLNRLKEFVKNDYDLLINYGFEENLYLKVITLCSQSKFKVGFSSLDEGLYDLSVSDEKRDVEVLNTEMEKYLKILKKI